MPILSIYADRLADVARRKQAIAMRIAEERSALAAEIDRLRHPMRSFDRLRSAGEELSRHAPVIALVAAPTLCLMRRPIAGGVGAAVRFGRRAARWWALWKMGSRVVSHLPRFLSR